MSNTTEPSNPPAGQQTEHIERLLQQGEARHRLFRPRNLILLVLLLLLGAGGYFYWQGSDEQSALKYRAAQAEKGTLTVTVSATGNLQPTNQVDVGSELSGIVDKVLVDDNDEVRKGQVLAQLDTARLQDAVIRSKANLAQAQAQVEQAQATVAETKANLARLRHVARLSGGKVPSKSELDTAEANLKRAQANVASADASVQQARAAVQTDETNLGKATIRSPINGIVLSRKIEPGQTVAASFQAPVLFTLAEDLSKMELQVDIDEADVGDVHAGQKATFSVDAYPGRSYNAEITRVSYGSQIKDGVVSYLAILRVNNDDLSLRPGMTGIAEITTLVHKDALLVPNAALRFTPPAAPTAEKQSGGIMRALMFRPRHRTKPQRETELTPGMRQLWVLKDGRPEAIEVKTGATDGKVTEVLSGPLKPGMKVITEVATAAQ